MRPIALFSRVVPLPLQGMPACLRALAVCAMAVQAAMMITLGHETVLHTALCITCVKKKLLHKLAQVAELIALTRACKLFESQNMNIYTDSKYDFGVVHDFGKI